MSKGSLVMKSSQTQSGSIETLSTYLTIWYNAQEQFNALRFVDDASIVSQDEFDESESNALVAQEYAVLGCLHHHSANLKDIIEKLVLWRNARASGVVDFRGFSAVDQLALNSVDELAKLLGVTPSQTVSNEP